MPIRRESSNVTLTNEDYSVILNNAAVTQVTFPQSIYDEQIFIIVNQTTSDVSLKTYANATQYFVSTSGSNLSVIPAGKSLMIQQGGGSYYQINNY